MLVRRRAEEIRFHGSAVKRREQSNEAYVQAVSLQAGFGLGGACFLLCFDVVEMFNKRSLPDEALEDIPEEKRLRHDLLDVFLGNNLSAQFLLVCSRMRTWRERPTSMISP